MNLAKFGYDQGIVDDFKITLNNCDLTIREVHAIIEFLREEVRKAMVTDEQS